MTIDTDIRKNFLLSSVVNHFEISEEEVQQLAFDDKLNSFLDDGNSMVLSANKDPENNIYLDNVPKVNEEDSKALMFFKMKPNAITPDNLRTEVFLSTMVDSPVSALYHSLKKVYSPLLLSDSKWSGEFDPRLQKLIKELEKGLGAVVRKGDPVSLKSESLENPSSSILTLEDEVKFWTDLANMADNKNHRAMANAYYETLEPLSKEFENIRNLTLREAEDVLETCYTVLDDLWKLEDWSYPQKRMKHLIDITTNALIRFIQFKISSNDIWNDPYSKIEENLQEGINLCDQVKDIVEKLTTLYWPNYGPHIWKGNPYKPERAIKFRERMIEILSIRKLHKQLMQLLSKDELEDFKTSRVFDIFEGVNPIQYNPYTESNWRNAVSRFEDSLMPTENLIAGKLKQHLRKTHSSHALQLLQEFKRYKELIRRNSVRKDLDLEREALLGKLKEYLKKEKSRFNDGQPLIPMLQDVQSEMVNNIYFVRQLEAKIKDVKKTGESLLSDLSSWPGFDKDLQYFIDEMSEYQKDLFDNWVRENTQALEYEKGLSLNTEARVIFFEAGKDMKVSYNPRLIGLTREVRMLNVLGFAIPHKIQQVTDLAKKFSRQALLLDQIAVFHNTIGDRIIPSQKPMMLEAAVGLANCVKDQKNMTWDKPEVIQSYIDVLKTRVDNFARQNNKLASFHKTISEIVVKLFDTDLLNDQEKWKTGLKNIRQIITEVEVLGFINLKSWRSHWDRQLYKALEYQYQLGLEALNSHLPQMKVELTYRQQSLQFKPSIEDIRMSYYKQLKRFLWIPKTFKGVSLEESSIFTHIVDQNAYRFSHLFKKAEELFEKLDKVRIRFEDWVALGAMDSMEEVISVQCRTAEDFKKNFQSSKAKAQEIGRLATKVEEKIECILISFAPVLMEIELLNRRYWDSLTNVLEKSIIRDIKTIEDFASGAIETLSRQPQTIEEIGEGNRKHKEFGDKTPQMLELFHAADTKNRILTAWTKENVEQIMRVENVWDNYSSSMGNYENTVSRQMETVKANLQTQVNNTNREINHFKVRWDQFKPKDDVIEESSSSPEKIIRCLEFIKEKEVEWTALREKKEKIVKESAHFDLKTSFSEFDEVQQDLTKYKEMWSLFEEFEKEKNALANEEWIIFRSKMFKFEDFLNLWEENLMNDSRSTTGISVKILKEIESYKTLMPILKFVKGDIFSDKHWNEMFRILSIPKMPIEKLTLSDFLKARKAFLESSNELAELNNRASGEVVIRQALNELDVWEIEARFNFTEHDVSNGEKVPLIRDWNEIMSKVGDNQILLQSIKGSAYYDSFGDRAIIWETKLNDLDEILNNLNKVQRKWVYLEPYKEQMKLNTSGFNYKEVFQKIDDDFKMIMEEAMRDNRVVSLLIINSVKSILNSTLDRLEKCQKSLNEFLEDKRSLFPRFYFIGDEDLLQILGQSSKPEVIESHLKKLFVGIHNVTFNSDNKSIMTINSIEGEIVPLKSNVRITHQAEEWLSNLSFEMVSTLKSLLFECLNETTNNHQNKGMDPLKYPSQILCLSEAIIFTEKTEKAIQKRELQFLLQELKSQLESYTSVTIGLGEDVDEDQRSNKVLELKLKALILDKIHNIEVVENLIAFNVESVNAWQWQKQLRYYQDKDNQLVTVTMVDAKFNYTYEYQGNAPKLVYTPLTDKCYLTLTQAMKMGLGGNPYGPAGTGKTESIKALGSLLGRQVLVFNCDEGIDITSMGRIFIGLIKCGAWGCFDEFNRLEEQTLSAVSMQIQPIQFGLKQKNKTITLTGKEICLDHNAGIFVTMNPADKEYGGRQKLPDNLKQLFRPVAMSKPDNELIAEITLYSEGFKNAKSLGHKLVNVFGMSEKLLTRQHHYDWGLRALKTVLRGCGSALQVCGSEYSEEEIVVRALRLNTMSKLTHHDTLRFDALVKDIFTGVKFISQGYEKLRETIGECITEMGLEHNKIQEKKVIELHEQLQQRMGVVVVGPSGSGKTTIISILRKAHSKLGLTTRQYIINPKALPRKKLLGFTDVDTREWNNGVLTNSALQAVNEPNEIKTWIILDGDIDPEWVESLNSVLDDNRLLTLPSGWRIQFGPNVNFIFETHELTYASPATISRMGIIHLSDEDTDVKSLVSSWFKKLNISDTESNSALRLIDELFFKALDWVLKKNDFLVETSLVGTVLNGLSYLEKDGAFILSRVEFVQGLIKGFIGNLNEPSKEAFTKDVLQWSGGIQGSLKFNCLFYNKKKDRLENYSPLTDHIQKINLRSASFPLVETPEVRFMLNCVSDILKQNKSFLLIGPEGSGKSLILQTSFNKLRATNVATVYCSSNVTPSHVLQKLNQSCISLSSSNGSRIFRPREANRLILYFKNLNTVKPDKYGTCMIIAFLEQILTYGGFYDDENLEWVALEGITIVASMTPGTGWGRHALNERFTSSLIILSMSPPSKEYLIQVYYSYFYQILDGIDDQNIRKLTESTVSLYLQLKQAFLADDQNQHQQFTPRDLTNWAVGIARYETKDMSNVVEAWTHEAKRLFRDRLTVEEDCSKFDSILKRALHSEWAREYAFNDNDFFFVSSLTSSNKNSCFGQPLDKITGQEWESIVQKGIVTFSRENRDIQDTVVLHEVLNLVARVDRALTVPKGSVLLSGRSGVGRRTAVSIVSAIHQVRLVTVKAGRGKPFISDIKSAMQYAALDDEQVFLLLEDHNFNKMPENLNVINGLLSSGEVPGLYTDEEIEPFLTTLRQRASDEGYTQNIFSYFAHCVKRNLHIILIMDYTNSNFIENCENNPALLKECQVQRCGDWSEESLAKIPKEMIEFNDQDLSNFFVSIHRSIQESTPRQYMTFIKSYKNIYERENAKIKVRQSKLSAGVHKLQEAKEIVEKLKAEAAIQEKSLAEKQAEANEALHMITDTMKNANQQKGEMEDLRRQTLEKEKVINERKKAIEIEMAEIKPLVEEAKKAVGAIKSSTLSEVRSLRAPPEVIRDILEGVLRLMGIQDTSWNSMKNFLAKRGVKDEILSFDARRITSKNREVVIELLNQKNNSFDPKTARRASEAAVPLASWVHANVKFSYVLEKIKPLESEQAKLHRNLKMAEEQIGELSTGLDQVDQQVGVLKERLNKFTKEAAEVEIRLDKTKETITIADGLVLGLQEEFNRWNNEVNMMEKTLKQIPLFSLLGSAFITYLTNAPEDIRKETQEKWKYTVGTNPEEFELNRFLSGEKEQLEWRSEGLPSDTLSVENAICILFPSKISTPYIVDPSSRATDWLTAHLTKREAIEVTTQNDERFILTLELAVRFGKTLLIKEANPIDPILYPILRKDIIGSSPYQTIKIQDKQVDYNDKFCLFMTTRNSNPDISPDISSVISIINFTITKAGLTGQLLGAALQYEKPELEQRMSELLKSEEEQKIEIGKLEDFLLEELASSSGNILENKELLNSLAETQKKSSAIGTSLKEAQVVQENLDREGNAYLSLADFASRLYFSISDLSKLNSMYRFSLESYLRLYKKTLGISLYKDGNPERRIEALKRSLQDMSFKYITRSLFKTHRVAFALHLIKKMHGEFILSQEWNEFLRIGIEKHDQGNQMVLPAWIEQDCRIHVERLRNNLPNVYESLNFEDATIWNRFARSHNCEDEFPVQLAKKLSLFQQLLTIQVTRPDRLYSAMEVFVAKTLKLKELALPALNLKDVFDESVSYEPILILISTGSDPSDEVRVLAQNQKKMLKEISMGQGQAEMAISELKQCALDGGWIILKNLHLMTFWLPTLEKELRDLNPHVDFRLWLTAEYHSGFSSTLSESCLKVAYESPPGIKRNLQRTLCQLGPERFSVEVLHSQTLFVLSWFHAVVQERRLYIPQGWCKFYEFSDSDFKFAVGVLERVFNENGGNVQWDYVQGLLLDAIYGGRIDNSHDIKILKSYLRVMFNSEVISPNYRNQKNLTYSSLTSLGPLLNLPSSKDRTQFWEVVNNLPEEDDPSSFGLPSNVNRSFQRNASSEVESQLRVLLRPKHLIHFEREKWQTELSPILTLWKQLNQNGARYLQMKLKIPSFTYEKNPVESFMDLESYNAYSLLQIIHRNLSGLSRVLRGTIVPDEQVKKLANSLLKRSTPANWQKLWSGPEDPIQYIRTAVWKTHKIADWTDKSKQGRLLKDELNLADLFHPETFLEALHQWRSRETGTSMNNLHFQTKWSRSASSDIGAIKIVGLLMEGASFNGQKLQDNEHDSQVYSPAPLCTFSWESQEFLPSKHSVFLPLYNNCERDKIITHIQVPCAEEPDKWLQAGVIFVLQSNYG